MLSANPDRVGQVTGEYAAVYQSVPVPADAPPERRHLIDINDAIAMGAMKRAIQIDAMAEIQLQAAERIGQELGSAAPGSVPLIEAEAAALLVRSNAYTQWALAELMRVRSAVGSRQHSNEIWRHDHHTHSWGSKSGTAAALMGRFPCSFTS
jgi:hypothetical protein